jgi:hypothetical protein
MESELFPAAPIHHAIYLETESSAIGSFNGVIAVCRTNRSFYKRVYWGKGTIFRIVCLKGVNIRERKNKHKKRRRGDPMIRTILMIIGLIVVISFIISML